MGNGLYAAPDRLNRALRPAELNAVQWFVARVLDEVPARLLQGSLFGSRARGEARPESDVDVLLVFDWLPPDREPQAGQAERIAEEVAAHSGVPVTVWSVAFTDLSVGRRTPMLIDALEDSIQIWCWPGPLPALPFTPDDAAFCVGALLERVREGGEEFERHLRAGDAEGALTRARDDIVRLCTALLLSRGWTRPRRGAAVRAAAPLIGADGRSDALRQALEWAELSFGPTGGDRPAVVLAPPLPPDEIAAAIDLLRGEVDRAARTIGHDGRGRTA